MEKIKIIKFFMEFATEYKIKIILDIAITIITGLGGFHYGYDDLAAPPIPPPPTPLHKVILIKVVFHKYNCILYSISA